MFKVHGGQRKEWFLEKRELKQKRGFEPDFAAGQGYFNFSTGHCRSQGQRLLSAVQGGISLSLPGSWFPHL